MDGDLSVLAAVLITWAGIVVYLVKVDRSVRRRDRQP
jgi:CcmD family protein